jgi:hypothetical protein
VAEGRGERLRRKVRKLKKQALKKKSKRKQRIRGCSLCPKLRFMKRDCAFSSTSSSQRDLELLSLS